MKVLRSAVLVAALAAILALTNWTILQKHTVMTDGTQVLLPLRPVDPLSLMQGYYMDLALAPETMPDAQTVARLPYTGFAVLTLDKDGVGHFVRIDDGSVLQAGEIRIRYRRHETWGQGRLDYGAQSFFFQEGDVDVYRDAKYALLRVGADGSTVLAELADEARTVIKPSK
jgi:uncharacterized membrane-anchored protein